MTRLVAATLLAAFVTPALAQAPQRVETPVALTHIIKKVDPVVPPEAAAAKVEGVVIADVTIAPAGTVSALTILSGPPMLHAAAERALRQWTFKPFLVNGRPRAVQVVLEVRFPDPAQDEEQRIYEVYRATSYACQRQLQVDPAKSDAPCADAARAADALPPDRVFERSHSIAEHGQALFHAGRVREAVTAFERALAVSEPRVKGPDADTADLHQILANLHIVLGDLTRADAEFATAIVMYDGALQQLPSMRERYAPQLRSALAGYAALKRLQGDTKAAAALDARAAAFTDVSESGRPPLSPPKRHRTDGDLQIVEPPDVQLSPSDMSEIAAVLKREGRAAWMVEAHRVSSAAHERSWFVYVYEKPDVVSPTLRRGSLGVLSCGEAAETGCPGWKYVRSTMLYAQLAAPEHDAASAPPIGIQPAPNSAPPSDTDVVSLVTWLRDHAVRAPTDRLLADVQPWPAERIIGWDTDSWSVTLEDPAHANRTQTIKLRRKDGRWIVVEMR